LIGSKIKPPLKILVRLGVLQLVNKGGNLASISIVIEVLGNSSSLPQICSKIVVRVDDLATVTEFVPR
jgi:hypothetical protein